MAVKIDSNGFFQNFRRLNEHIFIIENGMENSRLDRHTRDPDHQGPQKLRREIRAPSSLQLQRSVGSRSLMEFILGYQ